MNLSNLVKPFGSKSFLIGLGAAAAAYFLGPQLKELLKPVAVKGTQGAMVLAEKVKETLNQSKEKLNNTIVEKTSQVEKAVSDIGNLSAIMNDFKEEKMHSDKILEELKNAVIDLKNEISGIRGGIIQES
jgi:hypothetical protein